MLNVFFVLMGILAGCSSNKIDPSTKVKGAPKWLYAPDEVCSNVKELCASGSGESMEEADLNAKKSLASIFETKITSNFEVQTTSLSSTDKEEMTERVYSEVGESVDVVLKSVTIKKRYIKDNNYFALASIDKSKASKVLQAEIKELDDKLDFLYEQKKRTNIKQMLFLFDKRQLLNERLLILKKVAKPSKYNFNQLNQLRFKVENSKILIEFDKDVDSETQSWFSDLLNSFGYKITQEDVSYKIDLSKKVSEQYLKVTGFKKFEFNIIAQTHNVSGEKIGSFSISVVSTGRTENDAYLKIKELLYNKIEQNIYKLNME